MPSKQMVRLPQTDDAFDLNRLCVWGKRIIRFEAPLILLIIYN